MNVFLQGATGRGHNDVSAALRLQRPDVGSVVHPAWHDRVASRMSETMNIQLLQPAVLLKTRKR